MFVERGGYDCKMGRDGFEYNSNYIYFLQCTLGLVTDRPGVNSE